VDADEARRRFSEARVATLATVGTARRPHVVPIVFAVVDDTIYAAVDAKPKSTTQLRRFANVRQNPHVAVLVDHYDDADWSALWWVRADGMGRLLEELDDEARRAIDALARRYPQHRAQRPNAPVLAVDVERWSGWSAS
jgi:PPOX class probable F420-dependent enzyme